ncbi:PREDICTED: flotillin-2-like [Priapulus caudatus]|uniref:Flotillin-2-like n=1 Tax=Priapulus caudatus TaxID=37621 RepID=A0ABM1EV02_PRICU|nr:PREDICTED: flotillin-2-like [Priapulus caudatus]
MGNIHTVGPNEALVVSGGCCGADKKIMVIGGWAWACWFVTDVQSTETVEAARASAERVKLLGGAEASAIEAVGKSDAERMRMKAAAYKQYGNAALTSLVLDSLPKIAAELAAPLARTDSIVLLGGDDRGTSEMTRLLSQIPPSVQALTGVDLSQVLKQVPGAK